MATDFGYNGKTINSNGGFKPSGKNTPIDVRTRVNTFADIASIPVPYIGMIITVLQDETNSNKMTDYKVLSLKANASGMANSVVDQVQRYVDYLGAGSVSQDDINTAVNNYLTEHPVSSGATAEQANQIQANTAAIGTEELPTTAKTLKGAIAETFQSVSNGKKLIASAITDKGITTSNNDTFQTMANNILSISSSTQPSGEDAYREGRVLIWEDDFNGDHLDTSIWNYELGNIRNNELQVYTNNSKNVYIENSNLVLKAIKEDCEAYDKNTKATKTFNWTSGSVTTKSKKEFKYGRIEAKIKLTNVQGSFPAFWTLGSGYDYQYTNDANMGNKGVQWAYCGEIDIMEHFGYNTSTSHGSFYSTDESTQASILGKSSSKALDFDKYHIYSLEWTEDKLDIFVDDVLVSSADISDPKFVSFKQPHFILLDHAMGASGGTPSDSLTECYFYVDWVRVYAPLYENISSITLSESNVTLSNIGDTHILTAEFKPEATYDKTLVWESSNQDIAKVYGGKIHAINNGTCNITAKHGDVSAICSVTVGTGVVTSTLNSISAVYTQGGVVVYPTTSLDSLKSNLVVTGNYSDGTTETITDYSLSGTLTVGTSTITVTYNDKTTTFDVVVSQAPEESILFYFNSGEGTDINSIFNITKNTTSSIRCETVYNSDGYLEIIEKEINSISQDGYLRIEPKNFAVSGNLEIEAQLSVEFYGNASPNLEGVRIGIDDGTEGIYISINPNFGIRHFIGSALNPTSTSTKGEITDGTMFNLKINIDFINKNNAKIYLNDTLLDTINYSNWTKSNYSNRNNFFVMARNATATVNTIKIKNI